MVDEKLKIEVKRIIKNSRYLYKAKAYIEKLDIEEREKKVLIEIAEETLKKNKNVKKIRSQIVGLLFCIVMIILTFIIFSKFNSDEPNYNELLNAFRLFLFRVIPITSIILSFFIALGLSKEESYWSRFRSSSIITCGVLYSIFFIIVLFRSLNG